MRVVSWMVHRPDEPMVREEREETLGPGEALVAVAGCGVCHTDLGFFYEGVPTRHPFPLALGHEISGTVVEVGRGGEAWLDQDVIVPAVIPCGTCPACLDGKGSICGRQIFPGNDVHGGFGSHVRVPARGLCRVPDLEDPAVNAPGVDLETLSVIADAVSTPYQAIRKSRLAEGELAVFVGAGGVGGFGVQIAAALGAHTVAVDVDPERLSLLADHGAELTLRADELDAKALKARVRDFAKQHDVPTWHQRIFETSGTPAGQQTAFSLLGHGGYLGVVGFTPKKVELRLSNLMAYDAVAEGNWGCLPERYPEVLALVLAGRVKLDPFVEKRPLHRINETFEDLHARRVRARPVLVPEA